MEIRRLTQEESFEYDLLCRICFGSAADKDYETHYDNLDEHTEDWENKYGAFDSEGKIIAGLYLIPYEMNFDGHIVKMCGVQAVVTAPEARGTGVMNEVFNKSLEIMKKNGQIFSVLYPFSCAYYRKFGYEVAYQHIITEIDIMPFTRYPFPTDSVKFWKKGDDIADFVEVYEKFRKGRNYAIDRNDKDWEEVFKKDEDPYVSRRYSYVHYDANGKADSYIKFEKKENDYSINVIEMAWADKAGMSAIFGFVGGLRPQFNKVVWNTCPMDLNLYSLFPEARDIVQKNPQSVMTRIVDLPKVLELMRAPLASGRVVIDVTDKSMAVNSGKYAVSWENGEVSVETTGEAADMVTTIEAMAQMVTGFINSDMAAHRADTTIHNRHELLAALFCKKNLYMWERF